LAPLLRRGNLAVPHDDAADLRGWNPMQETYDFAAVEAAAQKFWNESRAFEVSESSAKPKFFCLSMLPYPSGALHMGHVRNYTIGDVISRYQRMNGKNVLQPMGWDAFGLPAENAAMANKVPPAKWTYDNIAYMKRQLQSLGFALDWSRELATCRPEYYRWNQWLFTRLFKKGLAYKKTGVVNWDPVDQTVLANEQVIEGRGWRTGALVEKREIPMYFLRITAYAEELLAALDKLPGWPEQVKLMQKNWIGRSEGVRIGFPYRLQNEDRVLWVFTTRADTLMGATFMAVAAEHPIAVFASQKNSQLKAFVDECKQGAVMEADLAQIEKKGMPTGMFVTHPITGDKLPVWVGNYVLMGYGEGAVMGVPAHDERDFAFALKYKLPIKPVIRHPLGDTVPAPWKPEYAEYGVCINSGKYDGLAFQQAVDAIAADLQKKSLGEKQVQWRLRDWGISLQRYWGTPIPIIHCDACGAVPVPEKDLPVVLPEDCVPDGSGNPLRKRADFVDVACPACGKAAKRETDTMDTFVDSSWYYMRYTSPGASTMVDARNDYWMPMDQYIGGIEHAILHLLYARFWTKVMRDMGLVKCDEPFTRLLTQGMLLNHIWLRRNDKGGVDYIPPEEVEGEGDKAVWTRDGKPVEYGGVGKMGKSERNGVDPQTLIDKYGADTARLYVMFAGKPEDSAVWSDTGVEGAYRFLRRLWTFAQAHADRIKAAGGTFDARDAGEAVKKARRELHVTLKQANDDYERLHYNTVVSASMIMLNTLEALADGAGAEALRREGVSLLLRILYPVAPHTTWVLWRDLGFDGDLIDAPWPVVDASALATDTIELVLQVSGKVRGKIVVPSDAGEDAVKQVAVAAPEVARHANGAAVKKVIVVPGRLVNVVV
jgi:leucyl-tRNA synthetase